MANSRKGTIRRPDFQKSEETIDRLKNTREYRVDEDNRYEVDRLERRLETLRAKTDFLSQDYVVDIVKRLKSIILSINMRLREEDDSEKRRVYKSDRSAYRRLLTWFSTDVENDLAEIEDRAETMLG